MNSIDDTAQPNFFGNPEFIRKRDNYTSLLLQDNQVFVVTQEKPNSLKEVSELYWNKGDMRYCFKGAIQSPRCSRFHQSLVRNILALHCARTITILIVKESNSSAIPLIILPPESKKYKLV